MRNTNNLTKDFIKTNSSMDASGCWIWKGTITDTGYGYYRGKMTHRIAWEIFKGPIPDGMCVCHTCDIRSCCNPEHLFIGSRRENLADMVQKDRGIGPTRKCRRVLTHDEVEEVIILKNSGWTYQQLSDHYGLACGSLHEIINGRNKAPKPEEGRRQYRSLKDKKVSVPMSKPSGLKTKRKKLSMYKGVTKNKNSGKWITMYKGQYVGSFTDEVEAALAFDDAVIANEGPQGVTNATLGNYQNVFDEDEQEGEYDTSENKVKELEEDLLAEADASDGKSEIISELLKRIEVLEHALLLSKVSTGNN